jgi:hypothetical protein
MMAKWMRFMAVVVGMWSFANESLGQDIRIYTTIRDLSVPANQRHSEQRSLMLFHAGKIYDYIEPAQEVTVFEPAHRRFTVMNLRRQLRSELTQDEIRQYLGLAEDEAQRQLMIVNGDTPPATRNALDLLQFQLKPEFATTFDAAKSQLSLTSPSVQYVVNGFVPKSPDIVEKYLHVADWTAQFNSVLHPQSLLPSPRLKLNHELRQRGLVPSSVKLQVQSDPLIHLEARHEWTWDLQKTDRQMIDEWEKILQSTRFRNPTFRQFQQEMLRIEPAKKNR